MDSNENNASRVRPGSAENGDKPQRGDIATRFKPGQSGNPTGPKPVTLEDDEVTLVEKLTAAGHAQRSIAKRLGIGFTTFKEIMKRDNRVSEALANGLAVEHDELVSGLAKAARNGNIVAAIFLLKARHGYIEGQQLAVSNRVELTFTIPKALTMQQYEAHVVRGELPQSMEVDRG